MSSDHHNRRAAAHHKEAQQELSKRAGEEHKAAKAEEAAVKAEAAAQRTSSDSTRRSKLREAERKRGDCIKARKRAADHAKKGAAATAKAQTEERAAAGNLASESKTEQRRAKREREREGQDRQREGLARDSQVGELRRRTGEVEAALRNARLKAPREVTILFLAGTPRSAQGDDLRLDREVAMLLQAATRPVRLVVFNACDSAEQAERACEFVGAAVGMDAAINDDDAKAFAGAFYNSLGYANSVHAAFQQAVAHVTAEHGRLSGEPRLHFADETYGNEMVIVAPVRE